MADQIEQIVVDLDVQQASANADKINAKLQSIEDKAARMSVAASEGTSRVILTASQTTQRAIDRSLDSYRRAIASQSNDQLKQADVSFKNLIGRVGGDTKAVAEATSLYKEQLKTIQNLRIAERERRIEDLKFNDADRIGKIEIQRQRELRALGSGVDPKQQSEVNAIFDSRIEKAKQVLVLEKLSTEEARKRIVEEAHAPTLDRFQQLEVKRQRKLGDLTGLGATPQEIAATNAGFDKQKQKLQDLANEEARAAAESKHRQEQSAAEARQRLLDEIRFQNLNRVEQVQFRRQRQVQSLISLGGTPKEVAALNKDFDALEKKAVAVSGSIGARIAEFITSPTYAARKSVGEFLTEWGKFGLIVGGTLVAVGAAAKITFDLIRQGGKQAEEILNLSDRLGVDVSQAAVLNAQAKIAGVGVDAFGGLVRRLSTNLAEGTAESRKMIEALQSIGIEVGQAGKGFKDPIDLLRQLSLRLNQLPTHAAQVDLLSKAFGRGAVELLPLIKNFSDTEKKARDTGVALHEDLYNRMAEVDDKIDQLGIGWDVLKLKFSEKVVAVFELSARLTGDTTGLFGAGQVGGLLLDMLTGKGGNKTLSKQQIQQFDLAIEPKIILPQVPKEALETDAVRRGRALVDQFNSRFSLDGLRSQISLLEDRLNKARSGVVKGRTDTEVQQSIREAVAVERQLEAKKTSLRLLESAPAAVQKAQTEYAASVERTNSSLERQKAVMAGVTEPSILSYFNGLREATVAYTKSLGENAERFGLVMQNAKGQATSLADLEKQLQSVLKRGGDNAKIAKGILDIFTQTKLTLSIDLQSGLTEKVNKDKEETLNALRQIEDARVQSEQRIQEDLFQRAQTTATSRLQFEETVLQQRRDQELLLNSNTDAKTIQAKIDGLLKVGEIEKRFLSERAVVEARVIDQTTAYEIASSQRTAKLELNNARRVADEKYQIKLQELNQNLAFAEQQAEATNDVQRLNSIRSNYTQLYNNLNRIRSASNAAAESNYRESEARILAITQNAEEQKRQLAIKTQADIVRAQQDAIIKSAEAIRDANTQLFDRFKRESDGIFDAMLVRSQSVFQAIGNAFKNIFLTVFKDIVSTQVARSLTQLVTGDRVGLTPAAVGTGPFAKIAQALGIGAKPTFGSVQSKLEQAGRLGDLQLVGSQLGNAVPVVVANASDIQSQMQKVEIKNSSTSSQVNQNFTLGGLQNLGGVFRKPLAATLALASFGGLQSAAASVPSGYRTAIEQVTSNISYGQDGRNSALQQFVEPGGFTGQGNLIDLFKGSPNALGTILGGGVSAPSPSGTTIPGTNIPINVPFAGGGIPGLDPTVDAAVNRFPSLPGFGKGGLRGGLSNIAGALFGLGGGKSLGGGVLSLGSGSLIPSLGLGLGLAGIGGAFKLGQTGSLGGKIGAPLLGAASGLFAFGSLTALFPSLLAAGPVGWIAAGAIGAAVGLFGALHKSKSRRMHDEIKNIYGVDIGDKKYLQQLVGIADQKYGGNIGVAARSLEVREMVELWAQATGQRSRGIVDRAQASVFSNRVGGGLQQTPTYFNGEAVLPGQTSSTIGLPNLNPRTGGYYSSPVVGGANVSHSTISLDADATQAILSGQAASYVNGNPRVISQAASSGMDASAARRSISSQVLRPAFLAS